MKTLLANSPLILMEAAVVEQLRRSSQVKLHDILVNAPLIYDPVAREVMTAIYHQYMLLAQQAGLPMLVCTPTWRASKSRVECSAVSQHINVDAVAYMRDIRLNDNIKIGGMIGCKHDCYQPEAGLSVTEAQDYHAWQIMQLVAGGVDYLLAETLPNVQEALGIAKAMAATQTPYIISFVIGNDGRVLDGTDLATAMTLIDANTSPQPLGYMVNCAHPSFLRPTTQAGSTFNRLIGFQANASALSHCELENATELKIDSISEWGDLMLELNHHYGVQILGGCCGTGIAHLQYLVDRGILSSMG